MTEDERFACMCMRNWCSDRRRATHEYAQSGLTVDVYRMSGSAGTECAGGIDKEDLMEGV